MTDSITPRDLFAAIALHSLLPLALEQREEATMKEAISLMVTAAWASADSMMDMRNVPVKKQNND
jgi:hypothetical protein